MQNARRAHKIRLCGHLRRYKKIVKKIYIIYNEILSAPCRFYVASVVDGQCSVPVKATERQFTIKQNRYLRTAGIPVHVIQMFFDIQTF